MGSLSIQFLPLNYLNLLLLLLILNQLPNLVKATWPHCIPLLSLLKQADLQFALHFNALTPRGLHLIWFNPLLRLVSLHLHKVECLEQSQSYHCLPWKSGLRHRHYCCLDKWKRWYFLGLPPDFLKEAIVDLLHPLRKLHHLDFHHLEQIDSLIHQ